jgi:integrase
MCQGKNPHAYLPVLQEFMGHAQLNDTEYYLHFSMDMVEDIRHSLEEKLGSIIPNNKSKS